MKWGTRFLPERVRPWFEPVLLGTSALMVLVAAFALVLFTLSSNAGTTPVPLGWVGINTVRDVAVALGSYGLAGGFLAFMVWLLNWRFGAKTCWPITHSALRWWKETIGASICFLAWLYLLLALSAWPARSRAKGMLDERWERGDWVWLRKNL